MAEYEIWPYIADVSTDEKISVFWTQQNQVTKKAFFGRDAIAANMCKVSSPRLRTIGNIEHVTVAAA